VTAVSAVVFDLGGVITDSPMHAFAAYEAEAGLPDGLIRRLNSTDPHTEQKPRCTFSDERYHRTLSSPWIARRTRPTSSERSASSCGAPQRRHAHTSDRAAGIMRAP